MKALIYVGFFAFEAFLAVYNFVLGPKRRVLSEHDRFADRAVYSRRRAFYPLAR